MATARRRRSRARRARAPQRRERDPSELPGRTWALRLRASNRPSRTDLRLSGSKTSLAKCRAEHLLLVRAEQLLSSPCLDDHESTIRRITQMHHEPVGGTAQVLNPGLDCTPQSVMIILFR
jgi:hypothetical protein